MDKAMSAGKMEVREASAAFAPAMPVVPLVGSAGRRPMAAPLYEAALSRNFAERDFIPEESEIDLRGNEVWEVFRGENRLTLVFLNDRVLVLGYLDGEYTDRVFPGTGHPLPEIVEYVKSLL